MMEALFIKIVNMSISASFVILVILAVRALLARAPKKWSYLLWSAAAFRLVCPWSFKALFSIFGVQPVLSTVQTSAPVSQIEYIPGDIGYAAAPKVTLVSLQISESINTVLPSPTPENSANPLQIWVFAGTVLWILGFAAILLFSILSCIRLIRKVNGAVRIETSCNAACFETDRIASPFILGLVRPRIYIPTGLQGAPLHYVLAHEQCHLRRNDHRIKAFAFLLLCIHWFNPLVWLAFHLMCRDMEMSCDEEVIKADPAIRKDYSSVLLSFASGERFPAAGPLAFGESGVEKRIKNALRWEKPAVRVTIAAAVLCLLSILACAANPPEKALPAGSSPMDYMDICLFLGESGDYYNYGYIMTAHSLPVISPQIDSCRIRNYGNLRKDLRSLETDDGVDVEVKKVHKSGSGLWSSSENTSLAVTHDRHNDVMDILKSFRADIQIVMTDGETYSYNSLTLPVYEVVLETDTAAETINGVQEKTMPVRDVLKEMDNALDMAEYQYALDAAESIKPQIEGHTVSAELMNLGEAGGTASQYGGNVNVCNVNVRYHVSPQDGFAVPEGYHLAGDCLWPDDPIYIFVYFGGFNRDGSTHTEYLYSMRKSEITRAYFNEEMIRRYQNRFNAAAEDALMNHSPGPLSELSPEEIEEWRKLLAPEYLQSGGDEGQIVRCFLTSEYSDPRALSLPEFLEYNPCSGSVEDETESNAVSDALGGDKWYLQIAPAHRYRASEVDKMLKKYAGITLDDMSVDWRKDDRILYLAEYDSFYTFISDWGSGMFEPDSGIRLGNIITLLEPTGSDRSMLMLQLTDDGFQILSHTILRDSTPTKNVSF